MSSLSFDGRVAIVTGAGAGLGRAYALLFGKHGASVVVNDLGGGRHGDGKSSKVADEVVQEIISSGGKAVADYHSVTEGHLIVQTALENFGRIDIVVNNAGILRDKSFASISDTDWNLIHDVHLKGSFKVSQAAWPHFKKQNYGRIIVTASNSGLYGNFGQANYSAAKMGLVGLCNTMAIEGKKYNIHSNVIVPTAASRLTEDILPPDLFAELKPELIAPVVVWLCHESCEENGAVIESAAGWATKYALLRGKGSLLRGSITDPVTLENVRDNWSKVVDLNDKEEMNSIQEASLALVTKLDSLRDEDSTSNMVDQASFEVTDNKLILYALGIGASVVNPEDLKFLYENHENFSAFPTYGIIPGLIAVMSSGSITEAIPNKSFDLSQVLHGEQYLEVFQPMPISGKLTSTVQYVDVLDKGKNAVIITDVKTVNESDEVICQSQISTFVVGAGGFGGKRTSDKSINPIEPPSREPDSTVTEKVPENQAAIYRLSGDPNPLHIDPSFASISGYDKPILHGLCSLGFSARHVLNTFANGDPSLFKSIKVRFTKPVYPGETLKTDMWSSGNRIHFRTSTVESNKIVLSGAYIDLHGVSKQIASKSVQSSLSSDMVFEEMKKRMMEDPSIAKKVKGVFLYQITKDGNQANLWTVDLKNNSVYAGSPKDSIKADATLTIDDEDMVNMALGSLNPQTAFMKGRLKIKGNIAMVQKLKPLLSSKI